MVGGGGEGIAGKPREKAVDYGVVFFCFEQSPPSTLTTVKKKKKTKKHGVVGLLLPEKTNTHTQRAKCPGESEKTIEPSIRRTAKAHFGSGFGRPNVCRNSGSDTVIGDLGNALQNSLPSLRI